MNVYLLSVIGTVLISAILTALIPEGKTATVIRSVAKLACTVAILAPILRFFKTGELSEGGELSTASTENFSKISIQADEEFIQYYCEIRVRETECALEKELAENHGVSADVTLLWEIRREEIYRIYDGQEIYVKAVQISPNQAMVAEIQAKIKEKFQKEYGCEVQFDENGSLS